MGKKRGRVVSIRWKLLILLLLIALGSLLVVTAIDYRATERMGREFATTARATLTERAEREMLQFVEDYATILRRERDLVEVILRVQAAETVRLLEGPSPDVALPVWLARDFDRDPDAIPGAVRSARHQAVDESGAVRPLHVSYETLSVLMAPDAAGVVDAQIPRVAGLTRVYRLLWSTYADFLQWQYTGLESGLHTSYPGNGGYPEGFDPRERPWYAHARDAEGVVWNPPGVDALTREVMVAASLAVRGRDGGLLGVTAVDVRLVDVLARVTPVASWADEASAMLLQRDDDGRLVVFAQADYGRGEARDWRTPIELRAFGGDDREAGAHLEEATGASSSGVTRVSVGGEDTLVAFAPADAFTLLALSVPRGVMVAEAEAAERTVLDRTRQRLRVTGAALALVVVAVVLVALMSSRSVTRPVRELERAARRVAEGDFRARAEVRTHDELGRLAGAFNTMVPQLEDRMRIRGSLELAMDVQQRLLPGRPPRVPGLEIAGLSEYCDETGGDYYDFVPVPGGERLAVVIGDVSGHGVGAALLMTTARAMLRTRLARGEPLDELATALNVDLTADSLSGQFMTLLALVVDPRTGHASWVSAGHDPALVYDPASDTFEELGGEDIPFGIEPAWSYGSRDGEVLRPGRVVVLGTDGIWEARNPGGEMFGKDRLREVIRAHAREGAERVASAVASALQAHRAGRAAEDDVTVVVLRVSPRGEGA